MPKKSGPISVFFLIRSLALGGAQRQLVQLARGLKEQGHRVSVGIFYGGGPLVADLEQAGVPVVDLKKGGRFETLGFLARLRRAILKAAPDVVYSFDGGANLFSALVRSFAKGPRLVWSIRASNMDLDHYDWAHRLGYAAERRLSRGADLIIANSRAGRDFAMQKGFPGAKIAVVANGIDTERFRPDAALREAQRKGWGLMPDQLAVGMLARLDPMKGYAHFLRAAAEVARRRPDARFLCIGDGREEARLKALAAELGIGEVTLFPGPTRDPASALNGLDLSCSASVSEGFSNAIAEAMACDLPCVATDVGDSATIVGDLGIVVPPADPPALAAAILAELNGTARPSGAVRGRIVESFSIPVMIERTLDLIRT